MRCEMRKPAVLTSVDVASSRRERRGETPAPCHIRCHASDVVAPGRALLGTHVLLCRIGLNKLLPVQCALLTGIPYLVPTLGSLCRRKLPQLAVFAALQSALSAQLLTRIKLLLPLSLHIGLSLCGRRTRFRLRGWRLLTLARRPRLQVLLLACRT
jgi:hypothetical protein